MLRDVTETRARSLPQPSVRWSIADVPAMGIGCPGSTHAGSRPADTRSRWRTTTAADFCAPSSDNHVFWGLMAVTRGLSATGCASARPGGSSTSAGPRRTLHVASCSGAYNATSSTPVQSLVRWRCPSRAGSDSFGHREPYAHRSPGPIQDLHVSTNLAEEAAASAIRTAPRYAPALDSGSPPHDPAHSDDRMAPARPAPPPRAATSTLRAGRSQRWPRQPLLLSSLLSSRLGRRHH
jgi:hypothetical protein